MDNIDLSNRKIIEVNDQRVGGNPNILESAMKMMCW